MLSSIRGYLWLHCFRLYRSDLLSLIFLYDSLVQLFGLNYRGIMDPPDMEWYTAILKECKSLGINDFLHDVSPYVVTRPLPPQRAAPTNVSQLTRPVVVPRHRIVELEIFESGETALERPHDSREDSKTLGTLFGEGSGGFNQFETI
jgi:hypothetical protein